MTAGQDQPAAGQPVTKQNGFYVSIRRARQNGNDTRLLLGPYDSKEEAETHVSEGRGLAESVDPRAVFDAFGVSRVTSPPDQPLLAGILNALAGAGMPEPIVTAYRHSMPGTSPQPPVPAAATPPTSGPPEFGQAIEL